MPTGIEQHLGLPTSAEHPVGYDDDFGYSWESLKPYMDGETLVIPVMDVIADSFWGSGLSAKSVQRALLKHKAATRIKLVVNCPGGNVHEGTAIYSLLVEDGRPVEAHVIGLAASMATIIILAAEVRILHTGCMLMVHEPALSWTGGNRHQLRSDANRLDITTDAMLDIYESRTGTSRAELAELMAAETWLSADDGRRLGFGTEVAAIESPMTMSIDDEGWHARRGAALAKYESLPAVAQHGAPLGWTGPSLAELRAGLALAEANALPTLTMALDGVRRARPTAQSIPSREATPPPRATLPSPKPAPTGGPETITMDEETLAYLGLKPGATQAEISAAWKSKRDEATALAKAKADAEAKAEQERHERLVAEAKASAAEGQRKADLVKAEAAKAKAQHEADVKIFLAGVMPSSRAALEEMCWTEAGEPDARGFASAKKVLASNPQMQCGSLTGASEQVQRANATDTSQPPTSPTGQQVLYPTAPGLPHIQLDRITGANQAALAKRRQELVGKYGTDVLKQGGFAVNP